LEQAVIIYVESDHTSNSYDHGKLQYNTTYYWKIVAKDGKTSTPGPVWKFTTQAEVVSEPQIVWVKCFGGSNVKEVFSIQETSDGGFVFVGQTHSSSHGSGDAWVAKIDVNGNTEWEKTFGGYFNMESPLTPRATVVTS